MAAHAVSSGLRRVPGTELSTASDFLMPANRFEGTYGGRILVRLDAMIILQSSPA